MNNKLLPHQKKIVPAAMESLENDNVVMIQLPTGTGKTMIASYLCASITETPKVLWISHESALVRDASYAVKANLDHLELKNAVKLTTMTRQGLSAKLKSGWREKFDVLVADEIHAGTSGEDSHTEYNAILKSKIFKKLIMLSATPWNLDSDLISKKWIRNNRVVLTMAEALRNNVMHNVNIMRVDTGIASTIRDAKRHEAKFVDEKDVDSAKDVYSDLKIKGLTDDERVLFKKAQIAAMIDVYLQQEVFTITVNKKEVKKVPPTIIYCPSVSNGVDSVVSVEKMLRTDLSKRKISTLVASVSGLTKDRDRDIILDNFRHGDELDKIDILIVCDMCRAGFDYPDLDVVVDFSLNPANQNDTIQKMGRVTRKGTKTKASRYYYTRSLHRVLPINGVQKQLSVQAIQKMDSQMPLGERDRELRDASVVELGSVLIGSGEIGEEDSIPISVGVPFEVETINEDENEIKKVLDRIGVKRAVNTTRVTSVGLYVEAVSDKGAITCEFSLKDTFENAEGARDPNGNKEKLLEMARNGEERPNQKTKIGKALANYTNKTSGSYSEEFDNQIRKLAPHWFINTADINKEKLLEMARNGEERPNQRKTKIGSVLANYTKKSSGSYSEEFDNEIRKLAPHWFINTADINKEKLLEMARNGEERPNWKSKIGSALFSYTNKTSGVYSEEFDNQIRKLAPHWFKKQRNNT